MAKTLTPGVAIQIIAQTNRGLLPDTLAVRMADEVYSEMWLRWPWRESLAELPPFFLQTNEAYYGPPMQSVPSDFHSLWRAWLRSSVGQKEELLVQRNLEPSREVGTPTRIEFNKPRQSFIVHPRPAQPSGLWWVEGEYKTLPTKVTMANQNSLIMPWEDQYYEVFRQGLDYKIAKEVRKDERWPLERQAFLAMLDDMAAAEGLAEGPPAIAPEHEIALESW